MGAIWKSFYSYGIFYHPITGAIDHKCLKETYICQGLIGDLDEKFSAD